jgi:peptide deformylase
MLKFYRCLPSTCSLRRYVCRSQSTNVYTSKWVLPSLHDDLNRFNSSKPLTVSICLIGDQHLRRSNDSILNHNDDFVQATKLRLHLALKNFRQQNAYGRGLSACQIGINLRMIALNLGYGPLTLINPKLIWSSTDRMTIWDDCISIPRILVKKQRAKSISIVYTDDQGNEQTWHELDPSISELLQHEFDHLEGILTIDEPYHDDKQTKYECVISMDEYRRRKFYFDQQVDHISAPTI